MGRRVLLVGATGLVGEHLLQHLAADVDVDAVVAPVRRPLEHGFSNVHAPVVAFDRLEQQHQEHFEDLDQVFCALGTTIRQAGSKAQFRYVDYELPMTVARLARKGGAEDFLVVTALGADPSSPFFYNRTKGTLERDLETVGFTSITIARPSFLLGQRPERRIGEFVGKQLFRLIPGNLQSVAADDVARALVEASRNPRAGTRILSSKQLRRGGR